MNPDVKQWRRKALKEGWEIKQGGGGHEKWMAPNGTSMVVVSTTRMHTFTFRNCRAELRRAGLAV